MSIHEVFKNELLSRGVPRIVPKVGDIVRWMAAYRWVDEDKVGLAIQTELTTRVARSATIMTTWMFGGLGGGEVCLVFDNNTEVYEAYAEDCYAEFVNGVYKATNKEVPRVSLKAARKAAFAGKGCELFIGKARVKGFYVVEDHTSITDVGSLVRKEDNHSVRLIKLDTMETPNAISRSSFVTTPRVYGTLRRYDDGYCGIDHTKEWVVFTVKDGAAVQTAERAVCQSGVALSVRIPDCKELWIRNSNGMLFSIHSLVEVMVADRVIHTVCVGEREWYEFVERIHKGKRRTEIERIPIESLAKTASSSMSVTENNPYKMELDTLSVKRMIQTADSLTDKEKEYLTWKLLHKGFYMLYE